MTDEKLNKCLAELSEIAEKRRKSAVIELEKNNFNISQNDIGFATGIEFAVNLIRAIKEIGE